MIDILVCVLNMCSFQARLRGTGADVTGLVVLLTCPLGPDPLAPRGLAAVLAQAGTAVRCQRPPGRPQTVADPGGAGEQHDWRGAHVGHPMWRGVRSASIG
jgi:hypothetical protein